jgi:hypothetical protein
LEVLISYFSNSRTKLFEMRLSKIILLVLDC